MNEAVMNAGWFLVESKGVFGPTYLYTCFEIPKSGTGFLIRKGEDFSSSGVR